MYPGEAEQQIAGIVPADPDERLDIPIKLLDTNDLEARGPPGPPFEARRLNFPLAPWTSALGVASAR